MAMFRAPQIWQPLRSPTSVRLLLIHPASEAGSEIHATLSETKLEDAQRYEAISWTWGSGVVQQPIWLNSQRTLIRENLWRFLWRLRRDSGSDRVLWVDALCINQEDNVEKSGQVAMIGDIFGKADSVLAWVGEHANKSEELCQRLSQRPMLSYWEEETEYIEYEQLIAYDLGITDQEYRVQAWQSFLDRPWFSRTWIVQEVVVAKQLLIHCGDAVVSWDQLPFFPLERGNTVPFDGIILGSKFRNYPQFGAALVRLEDLQRERDRFWHPRAGTDRFTWCGIHYIAMLFNYRQCTDPRDRIYALLTLEFNRYPGEMVIRPDYTLSVEEVFLSVFRQRYKTAWDLVFDQKRDLGEADDVAELATDLVSALGLGSAKDAARLLRENVCEGDDAKIWTAALRSLESSIPKDHA